LTNERPNSPSEFLYLASCSNFDCLDLILNVRQKLLNNVVKPSHHFYVVMLPIIWRLILQVKNIPSGMHVVVQHLLALLPDCMHLCILLNRDLDPRTVL
jgi:hypothetical protein